MAHRRRDFLRRLAAALAAAPMMRAVAAQPEEDGPGDFYARVGHRVFFANGHLDLSPTATAALDRQIVWLKQHPDYRIILEGHTDEHGTREFSLPLSERRAKAVATHMAARGIPSERMTVVGYGKERPADPRHTEAAWARNRRVDTVVIKAKIP